jgi:hypothetical protein
LDLLDSNLDFLAVLGRDAVMVIERDETIPGQWV